MTSEDIIAIARQFDVPKPVRFESTFANIDNDIHFCTDGAGKKFVLRQAKRIKGKDSEFEARLIQELAKGGLDTPTLIASGDGKPYVRDFAGWPYFAFEFVPGKQYEAKEIASQIDLAAKGGKILGEMHSIASKGKADIGGNRERGALTEIDAFLRAKGDERLKGVAGMDAFVADLEAIRPEAVEWIKENPTLCGAIHNDYNPQNLIFKNDKAFLIDFDWSCIGPFLKDVGQGIALWSLPDSESAANREVIAAFLSGYNQSAPFPAQMGKDLSFWLSFACLSDACTFFTGYLEGRYPWLNLERADQCRVYKRYLYFKAI